jgi:hypothetical protein
MAETTKLFNALPTVSSLNTTDKIASFDTNGGLQGITPANLYKTMYGAKNPAMMYDNILIMYFDAGNTSPRMVHLDWWTGSNTERGKVSDSQAVGIVVTEADKKLIIALDTAQLPWSSGNVTGGGTMTSSRNTASHDWEGQSNTAAQAAKSACSSTDYAPGYCYNYSKFLSDGTTGIAAGKWWLPSLPELDMIWRHINGINYALSVISGATQIPWQWHWSSTELSSSNAWIQYFAAQYGYMGYGTKTTKYYVRPVTALPG